MTLEKFRPQILTPFIQYNTKITCV